MEDVGPPYCPLLRLLILVRLKSLARGFEELAVGKALGSPRLGSELVRFYIYIQKYSGSISILRYIYYHVKKTKIVKIDKKNYAYNRSNTGLSVKAKSK